jgi:hypothetical protein
VGFDDGVGLDYPGGSSFIDANTTVWGSGSNSGTTTVWGSSFSLAGEN